MSPKRSMDGTVYPPVYGVASSGLEVVKMHSDITAPSMVPAASLSSEIDQIS